MKPKTQKLFVDLEEGGMRWASTMRIQFKERRLAVKLFTWAEKGKWIKWTEPGRWVRKVGNGLKWILRLVTWKKSGDQPWEPDSSRSTVEVNVDSDADGGKNDREVRETIGDWEEEGSSKEKGRETDVTVVFASWSRSRGSACPNLWRSSQWRMQR